MTTDGARTVRRYAIGAAERAIALSRADLGEEAWARLGGWVEDYVVECARLWALEQVTGRPQ